MTRAQAVLLFLSLVGIFGVTLIGLSMYLCKQRTGKWWQ